MHCSPTATRDDSIAPRAPEAYRSSAETWSSLPTGPSLPPAAVEKCETAPLGSGRSVMNVAWSATSSLIGPVCCARDVLHQVETVAGQVSEHAGAGELRVEPPRQRAVGVRGVVGEQRCTDAVSTGPIWPDADHLASQLDRRSVAVVEADGRLHPGRLHRGCDLGRVAQVAAGRLLDPDVLARLGRGDGHLAVHEVRPAHADDVDVVAGDQLAPVREGVLEPVRRARPCRGATASVSATATSRGRSGASG